MRVLKAVCCAAMVTMMAAPGVRADEWNKKTILTFSGPVQIPGATLPAGSYVFKLADLTGNRHVVQVFDKDEKKIYHDAARDPERAAGTVGRTCRDVRRASSRLAAGGEGVVLSGRADRQRVRVSEEHGDEDREGERTSRCSRWTTRSTSDAFKTAQVGRFDENGDWQVEGNNAVATTAQATTAPRSTTATTRAAFDDRE